MFKLLRIVQSKDLKTPKLRKFLDSYFHPELVSRSENLTLNGVRLTEAASQKHWSKDFIKGLPKSEHALLFYISQATSGYHMGNCVGQVCQKYVWREFFKAFPRGRIMVVELSMDWLENIWQGERVLAKQTNFASNHSMDIPQGMSGLQAENFPINVLSLASSGIYPLTLFDFTQTSSDLVFIYVPDIAITHAQMMQTDSHTNVLWRLHHILDDQWTFDGSRGPKSSASKTEINPVKNLDYFSWIIEKSSDRMADIISISDSLHREQLCMTFTRAVCDCVLSVSSQLPYMSKVFFFACLDKLCNLYKQIGLAKTEIDAWNILTDTSFLSGELSVFLKNIPGSAGDFLRTIVEWSVTNMQIDQVTPTMLRDIRNSHHGYDLKPETVARLFASSGELNNDVMLIATPLMLFILGQKWI